MSWAEGVRVSKSQSDPDLASLEPDPDPDKDNEQPFTVERDPPWSTSEALVYDIPSPSEGKPCSQPLANRQCFTPLIPSIGESRSSRPPSQPEAKDDLSTIENLQDATSRTKGMARIVNHGQRGVEMVKNVLTTETSMKDNAPVGVVASVHPSKMKPLTPGGVMGATMPVSLWPCYGEIMSSNGER